MFELLLSAGVTDSGSCPRTTHMLMMLIMVALLSFHLRGARSTPDLSLENRVGVSGHLVDMVDWTWLHVLG